MCLLLLLKYIFYCCLKHSLENLKAELGMKVWMSCRGLSSMYEFILSITSKVEEGEKGEKWAERRFNH